MGIKIAVNTRLLLRDRLDGIGWFTFEVVRRMARSHPEVEFHFLFDRPFDPAFVVGPNVVPHVVHPQARRPFLFRCWYDYMVPRQLKRIGADLFISADAMCSLRTTVPQLLVIHDLNFEHYPGDMPAMYSNYLRKRTPQFASIARRICTVSAFSKSDIITAYGIADEKIDVVYNGANEQFIPLDAMEVDQTRARLTGGSPYFVAVSSIHPRKNLSRLLRAYDVFRSTSTREVKLVIAGKKFWLNREMEAVYEKMQFRKDVIFTGWLPANELHQTVGAALASVYVSYFEGFGIPIIESFQCGVPVITSNITSMPEVAGDAALLVNPFSESEISDAMIRICDDELLRRQLAEKGFRRCLDFSWDKTAHLMWQSVQRILEQGSMIHHV